MKAYSLKFVHDVMAYRVDNTSRSTCEHFKIAPRTLIKWIRLYGREYDLTTRRTARECNDDVQLMRALRNDGMTLQDIADKFERSVDFVRQNTTKPNDLMSATAFVEAVKSGDMPTQTTRIMIKNKIVGTFVPVG